MLKDQNSLRDGFMPEKSDLKTSGTKLALVLTSRSEGICSWGLGVPLGGAEAQGRRAVLQGHGGQPHGQPGRRRLRSEEWYWFTACKKEKLIQLIKQILSIYVL